MGGGRGKRIPREKWKGKSKENEFTNNKTTKCYGSPGSPVKVYSDSLVKA